MEKKKLSVFKHSGSDLIFEAVVVTLGVFIIIVMGYPLVYVLSASFSDPMTISNGSMWLLPKGFNLNAYKEVFKSKDIWIGYRNTVIYAVTGTFINVVMTTMAAYPLSRPDLAGKNVLTFLITFTMFFSGGMIPSFINIQNLHLLNTMWSMVLPGAIGVTNMIIMRNYFQHSIPGELVEAAYADGCTNLGVLFRIVLPLSKSILAVMFIFYFVGHWNAYFNALLYLDDKGKYPLQVFLRSVLIQNNPGDMLGGAGSQDSSQLQLIYETLKYAIIVVSSVPVLVMYPFVQRYFSKGIMMGALKG